MFNEKLTASAPLILRFYAKCFSFPYEEMQYELQHMFRLIERDSENVNENESGHIDQILNIVNMYQGMELKEIRDEYVTIFSGESPCPLLARDFTVRFSIKYDSDIFNDLILESDIPVNPDEPLDSIINYLEYLSLLIEESSGGSEFNDESIKFLHLHVVPWILPFCEVLFKTTNVSFYREIAIGLGDYLSWFLD